MERFSGLQEGGHLKLASHTPNPHAYFPVHTQNILSVRLESSKQPLLEKD